MLQDAKSRLTKEKTLADDLFKGLKWTIRGVKNFTSHRKNKIDEEKKGNFFPPQDKNFLCEPGNVLLRQGTQFSAGQRSQS